MKAERTKILCVAYKNLLIYVIPKVESKYDSLTVCNDEKIEWVVVTIVEYENKRHKLRELKEINFIFLIIFSALVIQGGWVYVIDHFESDQWDLSRKIIDV